MESSGSVSFGEIGVCANCGTHTTKGEVYEFYYGTKNDEKYVKFRTNVGTTYGTRSHFKVKGKESAYICDVCVLRNSIYQGKDIYQFVIASGALLIGIALGLLWWYRDTLSDWTGILCFVILCPLAALSVLGFGIQIFMEEKNRRQVFETQDTERVQELVEKLSSEGKQKNGVQLVYKLKQDEILKQGYDKIISPPDDKRYIDAQYTLTWD